MGWGSRPLLAGLWAVPAAGCQAAVGSVQIQMWMQTETRMLTQTQRGTRRRGRGAGVDVRPQMGEEQPPRPLLAFPPVLDGVRWGTNGILLKLMSVAGKQAHEKNRKDPCGFINTASDIEGVNRRSVPREKGSEVRICCVSKRLRREIRTARAAGGIRGVRRALRRGGKSGTM